VAYITGKKEFWSLDFAVSPEVLIPRPETECLVEAVLDTLPERSSAGDSRRILDVGTGSGAIVVSLCKERPEHFYFASDISPGALELARTNARRHGLDSFIRFFCGRFFDPLKKTGRLFDAIVSNPPYIKSDDLAGLQPEVRIFEPEGALNGGAEGLDAVFFLIQNAPGFLSDTGCLFLEIGYDQKTAVQDMATTTGAWRDIKFIKDLSGIDRVVKLVR
jgi:release factor glutamine methyltransferase